MTFHRQELKFIFSELDGKDYEPEVTFETMLF